MKPARKVIVADDDDEYDEGAEADFEEKEDLGDEDYEEVADEDESAYRNPLIEEDVESAGEENPYADILPEDYDDLQEEDEDDESFAIGRGNRRKVKSGSKGRRSPGKVRGGSIRKAVGTRGGPGHRRLTKRGTVSGLGEEDNLYDELDAEEEGDEEPMEDELGGVAEDDDEDVAVR